MRQTQQKGGCAVRMRRSFLLLCKAYLGQGLQGLATRLVFYSVWYKSLTIG